MSAAHPVLLAGGTVGSRHGPRRPCPQTLPPPDTPHPLGELQDRFPTTVIGSYPYYGAPGGNGVNLVVRSTEPADLDRAGDAVLAMIRNLGGEVLDDVRG